MRLDGRPCGVGVAHGAVGERAEQRMELGAGMKKGRRRKNAPTGVLGWSVRLGKRATRGLRERERLTHGVGLSEEEGDAHGLLSVG